MNALQAQAVLERTRDIELFLRAGEACSENEGKHLLMEDILNECLEHERDAVKAYYKLLKHVEGKSIMPEEFARNQIATEEMHEAEIKKMLRDNF